MDKFNPYLYQTEYTSREIDLLIDDVYSTLIQLVREYEGRYDELYPQLSVQVSSVKFGRGGEGLPRGFYCPSPVRDILVGGYRRGKILKRVVNWEDITAYGFNSDGELILLERPWHDKELIFRMPGREIGIGYDDRLRLNSVEECVYCGGKLSRYAFGFYLCGKFHEVDIENYSYSEDGLDFVADTSFAALKHWPTHKRYQFFRDENGCLSTYSDITNPANPIERRVLIKNRKA